MDSEKLEHSRNEGLSQEEISTIEIAEKSVRARLNKIKPEIDWDNRFIRCMGALEGSKASSESIKVGIGMVNVLKEIARRGHNINISEEQLSDARLAGEMHDVGKAGPLDLSLKEKYIIRELFETDKLERDDIVEEVIREKLYPGDKVKADEMLLLLKKCGVDISDSMLKCWRKHASWSAEIIKECCKNVSKNVTLPAILHHIDNGEEFNFTETPFEEISEDVLRNALALGQLEKYLDALKERIIIAVDKYGAQTGRDEASHSQAISWVENDITQKFPKNDMIKFIVAVMKDMGKEKIFEGLKNKRR